MPWNTNDQVAPPFTGNDRVNGPGGALCLTALRGAYRRVAQSRICTTVLRLARTIAVGVEAASARLVVGANHSDSNNVAQNVYKIHRARSVIKQLHQLVLISLQFTEERSELLVIEFYPC